MAKDSDHVSQLANHFERAILAGELAAGDLLPSERHISAEMGVSRSVVREALGRLASLGLVRSQHGSGTRVEAPSSRQVTVGYRRLLRRVDVKLEDLAAVRLPLETTIASLAALHRNERHIRQLESAQKQLARKRGTLETQVQADVDFHAVLAEATGNTLFGTVLAPIQELLIESRRRTLGRYGVEIAHEHHAVILDAVKAADPNAAAAAMRTHLEANFQHLSAERRK